LLSRSPLVFKVGRAKDERRVGEDTEGKLYRCIIVLTVDKRDLIARVVREMGVVG